MDLDQMRQEIVTCIVDLVEVLSGQELVAIVCRDERDVLTPFLAMPVEEMLADRLNGWMDHAVWNGPKTL